jgi:hypothetical protein
VLPDDDPLDPEPDEPDDPLEPEELLEPEPDEPDEAVEPDDPLEAEEPTDPDEPPDDEAKAVALTVLENAEDPILLTACTTYWYVVPAAAVESVNVVVVPEVVPTRLNAPDPFDRSMLKEAGVPLS